MSELVPADKVMYPDGTDDESEADPVELSRLKILSEATNVAIIWRAETMLEKYLQFSLG